jgi:hypothetical protein
VHPVKRLVTVGAAVIMAAGFLGVPVPAALAVDEPPAEYFDADGNPIEFDDEMGFPEGDADNAGLVDEEFVDEAARLLAELNHALGSAESLNMKGFARSLYRGKWYMPNREDTRRCIIDREANFNYRAVSRGGLYRGAYQMNRRLALGATHMMLPEVRRELGEPGVQALRQLRRIPTQQWNRYWQDRAFWTIWRNGRGKSHWRGGAWKC